MQPEPIQKPDNEEARVLYDLYLQIFDTNFSAQKKKEIMTHILGHEPWSFRVTAISRAACLAIAEADYKKPIGKLARDHKRPRAKTCKTIFERKHDFEEWWDYVWEGDATILVTKEENLNRPERDDDIPLNWQEGYFGGAHIGWFHRKRIEGELVREICGKFELAL